MPGKSGKNASSELMQIVFLTLAMTGGTLMLLFLMLHFFLLPGKHAEVVRAQDDYTKLAILLRWGKMKDLRLEEKNRLTAGEQDKDLNEIITDRATVNGVLFESQGRAKVDARTGIESRNVKLQPAGMQAIFRFIVEVREAKKTVRVETFNLQPTRGATEMFKADITFIDYAPLASAG